MLTLQSDKALFRKHRAQFHTYQAKMFEHSAGGLWRNYYQKLCVLAAQRAEKYAPTDTRITA